MSLRYDTWRSFERLADALAREILEADATEILADHAGQGARVRADALRQAVRRGLTGRRSADEAPGDRVRDLEMRPQREGKP